MLALSAAPGTASAQQPVSPALPEALASAYAGLDAAWAQAPLSLATATFVDGEVAGFGRYTPRTEAVFTEGETLTVYPARGMDEAAEVMDQMAEQLGQSRQTLYRKLKAEGENFENLLDELRHAADRGDRRDRQLHRCGTRRGQAFQGRVPDDVARARRNGARRNGQHVALRLGVPIDRKKQTDRTPEPGAR